MILATWRQLTRGIARLLGRRRTDADIDDEVAHYFSETESAHQASGMSREAARRAAVLELGGSLQVRETVRSYGWENRIEEFIQDCRLALRRLRSAPGFAAAVIVTLGVGVGAATAIFSAVRPVLLEPLPYPDADRIRVIRELNIDGSYNAGTFGMYHAFAERSRELASVAVMRSWQPTLLGDRPERLDGQRVSAAYFDVLGIAPWLGRAFTDTDDSANGPPVVILSHGLWERRFAREVGIVGQRITLDDLPYTVIGVMPADFENAIAPGAQLWAPLQYDLAEGRAWGHHLETIGRLRSGASPDAAGRELNAIASSVIATQRPPTYSPDGDVLWAAPSLHDAMTRGTRPALLAMLGATALLLLMACVNVANLLIGKGLERQPELGLRLALGADRRRIMRQLITESLVLTLPGGILGAGIAYLGVRALVTLAPPQLPRVEEIGIDGGALLFAGVLTLVIGSAFGLMPALRDARRAAGAWKTTSRHTSGRSQQRLRGALIVTQVALALTLLAGSGLLLRSLQQLLDVPVGFDPAQTVTLQIQTSALRYPDDAARQLFFDRVLDAAAAVPGVQLAALTNQLPLSDDRDEWGAHFEDDRPDEGFNTFRYAVSDAYFETMRIPLREGRLLNERDDAGAPRVAVIGQSLARVRFPNGDAIGRQLRIGPADSDPYTIVGVAGDVTQESLALGAAPAVYVTTPQWRFTDRVMTLVVRARGDAGALVPALRDAVSSVDPEQPITRVARLDGLVADSLREQRFAWLVFQAFALAALVLAATGLYGVVAASVAERTREIGVRSALGAARSSVVTMVLTQGIRLTVLGLAIGLAVTLVASRTIQSLLFGVSPTDPLTYAVVALLLVGVSVLACGVPAWRAARIDPAITLRAE